MVYIGHTVRLLDEVDGCPLVKGELYHVQDTNALTLSAKIGKPDTNGLVWDTWWVSNQYLETVEAVNKLTVMEKEHGD